MCFSAEADLVAGVVIGVAGVDAVRHVHRPRQWALAAIPVVLAVHQTVEAFVWWGLEGTVSAGVAEAARWLYLLIALGVVPVLVPFAVVALEPRATRAVELAFAGLGAAVAVVLTAAVIRGPIHAAIEGHHVSYVVDVPRGGLLVGVYVVAVCGSLLASHHRHVRWFGAVNLVVVAVLAVVDRTALISLWCLWAGLTSIGIAWHLRWEEGRAPMSVGSATMSP